MSCIVEITDRNRPKYMIPVSSLPDDIQARYYRQKRQEAGIPPPVKEDKKRFSDTVKMSFEDFSEEERERIIMWRSIIEDWQHCRSSYPGKKTEADKLFIAKCKPEHPDLQISADVLYRKWAAYKENDLAGIPGKRGGNNKGKTSIPKVIWDYFLYLFLCDSKPTVSRCYELTKGWTADFYPDLVAEIPHERCFRRHIKSDVPEAVIIFMREGDKAMKDKCTPFISRLYDKLCANDVWIADNHTLDIQSYNGDGKIHRLYLTAFLDAKSGVLVGWNITDSPTSQSTVMALRHGMKMHEFTERQKWALDKFDELSVQLGSQKKAAARIGISDGSMSSIKKGTYDADPTAYLDRVIAYFENKEAAAESYCRELHAKTFVSENVYAMIRNCHLRQARRQTESRIRADTQPHQTDQDVFCSADNPR